MKPWAGLLSSFKLEDAYHQSSFDSEMKQEKGYGIPKWILIAIYPIGALAIFRLTYHSLQGVQPSWVLSGRERTQANPGNTLIKKTHTNPMQIDQEFARQEANKQASIDARINWCENIKSQSIKTWGETTGNGFSPAITISKDNMVVFHYGEDCSYDGRWIVPVGDFPKYLGVQWRRERIVTGLPYWKCKEVRLVEIGKLADEGDEIVFYSKSELHSAIPKEDYSAEDCEAIATPTRAVKKFNVTKSRFYLKEDRR